MNSKRKEDGSAGTTPIQRAAAESIRWGGRDGRSCTLPPLAKKQLIGLHFHSALLIRRASRPDFVGRGGSPNSSMGPYHKDPHFLF